MVALSNVSNELLHLSKTFYSLTEKKNVRMNFYLIGTEIYIPYIELV